MKRLTYILQQWLAVISLPVSYRLKNIAVALFSLLCVHICSATVIKGKYYFQPEDATFDSIAHLVLTSEVNRANDTHVTEWIGKMKDIASRSGVWELEENLFCK
ncbi:MAG: hypothetical protein K2K26_04135 [Muribaculaceae bacterium]|nr:hypothetical protein [Muribaculaceae bacterium]